MAEPDQFPESRSEKIPERPKKSAKDYYKEYRKRLKSETARYEDNKKQDCMKKKKYRRSLMGEKKKNIMKSQNLEREPTDSNLKQKPQLTNLQPDTKLQN
ncbi:hypothetical protein MAR_037119 [Mya arenaria]|uniref:Uncharacterized protein n=1 Tax=Mya arenaria TaxID=6604 RepID=A0ABY7FMM4_MYAAR|nr:hypothetical protein MAR_037119 [Mya arenaria]